MTSPLGWKSYFNQYLELQILDFIELLHSSCTLLKWEIACNFATFGFHGLFFISLCKLQLHKTREWFYFSKSVARSSQFCSHSDWSFRKLSTSLVSMAFSPDSGAVCSGCSVPCQVSEKLFFALPFQWRAVTVSWATGRVGTAEWLLKDACLMRTRN